MSKRTLRWSLLVLLVGGLAVTVERAWAMGFILGQTKEELKLKYDVTVYDHNTGRVTVTITITDDGKLKPIRAIELHIPSKEKHADGQGTKSDLSLAMATRKDGDKTVASVHIRRDWAEKAEFWLTSEHMDGKYDPTSRVHFIIPLEKLVKEAKPPTPAPIVAPKGETAPPAAPAK